MAIKYNTDLTKVLREKLDLSRDKFGKLLDITERQVYRYEHGTCSPPMDKITLLYGLYVQNGFSTFPLMLDEDGFPIEFQIIKTKSKIEDLSKPDKTLVTDLIDRLSN
jgi:transcriptional regulator with XRE-family HTH domain